MKISDGGRTSRTPEHSEINDMESTHDTPLITHLQRIQSISSNLPTALATAVAVGRLTQFVAEELGVKALWPLRVFSDSMQSVSFQRNTTCQSKLRGCFDLRDKAVVELRDKNIIKTIYIPRVHNLADVLTHPVTGPVFQRFRSNMQKLRLFMTTLLGGMSE